MRLEQKSLWLLCSSGAGQDVSPGERVVQGFTLRLSLNFCAALPILHPTARAAETPLPPAGHERNPQGNTSEPGHRWACTSYAVLLRGADRGPLEEAEL